MQQLIKTVVEFDAYYKPEGKPEIVLAASSTWEEANSAKIAAEKEGKYKAGPEGFFGVRRQEKQVPVEDQNAPVSRAEFEKMQAELAALKAPKAAKNAG